MEAAGLSENVGAGTKVEMVGIAQDDARLYIVAQFAPFMAPQVPTGMKIGVGIVPWSVVITPARALVDGAVASMTNFIWAKLRISLQIPSPVGVYSGLGHTRSGNEMPYRTHIRRYQFDCRSREGCGNECALAQAVDASGHQPRCGRRKTHQCEVEENLDTSEIMVKSVGEHFYKIFASRRLPPAGRYRLPSQGSRL